MYYLSKTRSSWFDVLSKTNKGSSVYRGGGLLDFLPDMSSYAVCPDTVNRSNSSKRNWWLEQFGYLLCVKDARAVRPPDMCTNFGLICVAMISTGIAGAG